MENNDLIINNHGSEPVSLQLVDEACCRLNAPITYGE